MIFALSVAMVAYTGIETVSNMAEEAKDPGHDIPKAVNLVLIAVLGVYAGISVVALSALPVIHHGVGFSPALQKPSRTPATRPRSAATSKTIRCWASSTRLGLHGTVLTLAQRLRRRARRDDPVHRHERRPDRDLAAVVVAVRAPPAAEPLLPAAPDVPHAVVHDRVLLDPRRRC